MAYHGKILSHEYVRTEIEEVDKIYDLDHLYQLMDRYLSSHFKPSLIRKLKLRNYSMAGNPVFDVSIQVRGPEHEIRMYFVTFVFTCKATLSEEDNEDDA